MTRPANRPQLIAVLIVATVAVLGVIRIWSRQTDLPPPKPKIGDHHYRIDLVAEEEASPGKVIQATDGGQELASYMCTPEDAAVGVVVVSDTVAGSNPVIQLGDAKDPMGHLYSVRMQRTGKVLFVIVSRGFATAPASITCPLSITQLFDRDNLPVASTPITLTKIAKPHREVFPPSEAETRIAEKTAIAEMIEGQGGPFVRMVAKNAPNEHLTSEVVATSYSSKPTFFAQGAYSPDAIKVRVSRWRNSTEESTLTYKNASVVDESGSRQLWLPTSQRVGSLLGYGAEIERVPSEALSRMRLRHSPGDVALKLDVPYLGSRPVGQGTVTCTGISPSLDEMGLDSLRIHADSILYSEEIKATGVRPSKLLSDIPELQIRFGTRHSTIIESKEFTLPVHKVKSDPLLFSPHRPTRPTGLSLATGGTPMPLPGH